jgi:hypothetical protein
MLDAVTDALTDRARRHGAIRQDITGQDVPVMGCQVPAVDRIRARARTNEII